MPPVEVPNTAVTPDSAKEVKGGGDKVKAPTEVGAFTSLLLRSGWVRRRVLRPPGGPSDLE